MTRHTTALTFVPSLLLGLIATPCFGDGFGSACNGLPGYSQLKSAIAQETQAESSGLNNQMWATVENRDGVVCAVAFSGVNRGAQWPGSRVISAQKANHA